MHEFLAGAWKAWLAAAVVAVAGNPDFNIWLNGQILQLGLPDIAQSVLLAVVGYVIVWAKANRPAAPTPTP